MSNVPELPAELFAQLWGEALQRHPDASVHPVPTSIEVTCLAYAAGWEARGVVKDSLTTAEDSSVVGAPDAALVARVGRLVQPPADVENAVEWLRYLADLFRATERNQPAAVALDRAASMLEQLATKARWSAALAAAPSDGQSGATEEELQEARREVATLTPAAVADRLLHLSQVQARQAREHSAALCERAAELLPAPPPAEGEVAELVAWLLSRAAIPASPDFPAVADRLRRAAALLRQQAAELERLRALADEVSALVEESEGVAGLHLNGDIAPWDELLPGGRFERLTSLPSGEVEG